jgi:hypothetical protein
MVKKTKGEVVNSIHAKLLALEMEIKNDVSVPIVASFGFIIALVWRDAIKGAVDEFLLSSGLLEQAYVYNFISAIVVTVIVITIMIFVTRFSRSRREDRLEKKIHRISQKFEGF